jgi:hypothetical protein
MKLRDPAMLPSSGRPDRAEIVRQLANDLRRQIDRNVVEQTCGCIQAAVRPAGTNAEALRALPSRYCLLAPSVCPERGPHVVMREDEPAGQVPPAELAGVGQYA